MTGPLRIHRRNITLLCTGESCWGFQSALVTPTVVLCVLLTRLGASPVMIGSIFAIEAGGILLPQIFGIFLFRSNRDKKRRILLWHVIFMIPFLFFMSAIVRSVSWIGNEMASWMLLLCFLGFQTSIGVVVAAWIEWVSQIIPREIRGTVFGISWSCSALMGTLAGLWAGRLIRIHPGLGIYSLLYAMAGFLALLSIGVIAFVGYREARQTGLEKMSVNEVLETFRLSLRNWNVNSFLIGRALMLAEASIVPFIAVYYSTTAGGSLGGGVIVSCGAAMAAGAALGNVTLGWLGDQFGHHLGLVLAALVMAVGIAIMMMVPGVPSCVAAYFLTGFGLAAGGPPHNNLVLDSSPHPHLLSHITAVNMALSPIAIFAPLLAGKAVALYGLKPVFFAALITGSIAAGWFLLAAKAPLEDKPELA